ncbi:oxidoreductase [Enemella evansiae]|uniref:Gfo/Idh/MocA family protein n=1 Tax=Enemella evansiae TaxID=2016499 RepID=UPI000B9611B1|nr:Gfo/Idh/MocA family oxidoreductase [Enemella evansiae]OYO17036.1 oxidoreductase [Enemella evansiae]
MASSGPVGVGLIGTGMISTAYLENLTRFPDIRVVVLGDRTPEVARAQAERFGIEKWGNPADVLADPEVELVVNLTIPAVHAQVSGSAIDAGKHVWSEKPISTDRASGQDLLARAEAAGLLVGVAPDTVLGPGVQTARRAIARGDIGQPLSASTVLQYIGPDTFHPGPEFLFAPGAGPLFDMGPYYLTTLVHVFGSVRSVAAYGSIGHPKRTIGLGPRRGTEFEVQVPTHVAAIAEFVDGGIAQSVLSFDSPMSRQGVVEITGTEGTLVIPDPNRFSGQVRLTRIPDLTGITDPTEAEAATLAPPVWEDIPVTGRQVGRGLGVLDLARAVRTGDRPLASGALGLHVLDTLIAIDEAMATRSTVPVQSRIEPVPPVAENFDPFAATL